MKIGKKDIDINEAIDYANYDIFLFKRRSNNLLLSDYQISVLLENGIYFNDVTNMHYLLVRINYFPKNNYYEELDIVASQIGEMLYYSETKK